jgi:hypothetical protein
MNKFLVSWSIGSFTMGRMKIPSSFDLTPKEERDGVKMFQLWVTEVGIKPAGCLD